MSSHFPEPVLPPNSVAVERANRERQLQTAIRRGGIIRCLVILAEIVGFAYFGSAALLLDALASTMDLVTTVALSIFIRLAGRPPDQNHPFGHGRFEPLAGLQVAILLVVVGAGLLIQQGMQISSHAYREAIDPRTWIIPFVAVILLEGAYQQAKHSAKTAGSPALMAEAWHYRVDAVNSLIATVALAAAALVPSWSGLIDRWGAVAIAALMVVIGLKAIKGNVQQLLDHAPGPVYFDRVTRAAQSVEGVEGTEKIRIQVYGPDAHVDIDIEVLPELSVERAHRISQKVRAAIQKEWPAVRDVTVHVEPFFPGDH